jgi:flap endonuclease-1
MGIKNLLKFLNNYDNIITPINSDNFNYEKIAIDISIILYQVIIGIRNTGADLTNKEGEITSHILGLFNRTILLLKKKIIPIYVFDGIPPPFKNDIIAARREIKRQAYIKLDTVTDPIEKIKYFKKTVSISKKQIDECKQLLELMGIPYIEAPAEADSQCAYLVKKGIASSVITEDMDILAFGSDKIYRNFSSKTKETIELKLSTILENVDLTYEQFIEFCILLGCDYCDRIKDITPNELYEYYYKYKNIPDTIKAIKDDDISVPNVENYNQYIEYFKNPPAKECEEISLSKPNIKLLVNILVSKYGLIKNKLTSKLLYLETNYNNYVDDN